MYLKELLLCIGYHILITRHDKALFNTINRSYYVLFTVDAQLHEAP